MVTVNQLLFACEKYLRGSREPHLCEYSRNKPVIKCFWYIIFQIIFILIAYNLFVSGKTWNKSSLIKVGLQLLYQCHTSNTSDSMPYSDDHLTGTQLLPTHIVKNFCGTSIILISWIPWIVQSNLEVPTTVLFVTTFLSTILRYIKSFFHGPI